MRDWDWSDMLDWLLIPAGLLAAALIYYGVWFTYRMSEIQAQCIALGYPNGLMAGGVAYCRAQIDNSDVVVPLAEAKKR